MNTKYYLVIEKRHGDFLNIDIFLLGNFLKDYTKLENIDDFTMKLNTEDIIDTIRLTNIVPEEYLEGKLLIIDNFKRTYKVITKDLLNNFELRSFIENNIKNKNLMNRIKTKIDDLINNKLNNMIDGYVIFNSIEFKDAIDKEDTHKILDIISRLPYIELRQLIIYICENLNNKKEINKGLLREKN